MATTVDQLIVEIRAETKGLRRGLDDVNKKLDITNKKGSQSILTFKNLAKGFGALGLLQLGKNIVSTARTFEDLEATLRAVTQSTENAELAMSTVTEFTKTTPFQLANVTEAFTRFYQAGITPTSENLTAFGNIAAANNKDITQLAQAVFNATTGEMEMMKQFGIKAKQHGDQITMIFEGQETTFKNTSENISGYLLDMGNVRFEGAIDERLKTLSGSLSNLADNASLFANDIGESGLTAALTKFSGAMQETITTGGEGGLATVLGQVLGAAVDILTRALKVLDIACQGITLALRGIMIFAMKVKLAFFEFAMGSNESLNKVLTFFEDFANDIIEIYNKIPFFDPVQPVEINISTQAAKDKVTQLKADIQKELNDDTFLNGYFGDGTTTTTTETEPAGEKGSIIPPSATNKSSEAVDNLKASMEELSPIIAETTNQFSSDFVGSLMEGENAMDSFKDLFKDMVKQVIATAMQMLVIKPIMDAIFGAMGLPVMPTTGKAGGGTIQGNRPTLVGERGPEIFVPNTGGTIMNNMNSKNAMGGGTTVINQSINFATGVVPTVRAEVMKMMPQIAEVTKGAVAEAAVRGGNYRRMLQGG